MMKDLTWEIENGTCKDRMPDPAPPAVQWGRDQETKAKALFELLTMTDVVEEGFIIHPSFDYVGVSPDGLIDKNCGLEIKCPYNQTYHIAALEEMPRAHVAQVQGSIWVTEREYWWFASFDPRFPIVEKQLITHKIYRDQTYIDTLEAKCIAFWDRFQSGKEPEITKPDPADMLSQIPHF